MSLMRERAARGAEWLDGHDSDWFHRINVEKLDLEFSTTCILGQYEADRGGDFNTWHEDQQNKRGSRVTNEFIVNYGFSVRHESTKNWRKQTEAWREQINARLQRFRMAA